MDETHTPLSWDFICQHIPYLECCAAKLRNIPGFKGVNRCRALPYSDSQENSRMGVSSVHLTAPGLLSPSAVQPCRFAPRGDPDQGDQSGRKQRHLDRIAHPDQRADWSD